MTSFNAARLRVLTSAKYFSSSAALAATGSAALLPGAKTTAPSNDMVAPTSIRHTKFIRASCCASCSECASEVPGQLQQCAAGLRQAPEVRVLAAEIGDDETADGPGVREVVVGFELHEARSVVEVGIDEPHELEIRDERIDPVGAQKQRVLADRLLLIEGIGADEPELARNAWRTDISGADPEPVVPVAARERCLIEVVFEIEGDLRFRRIRGADR